MGSRGGTSHIAGGGSWRTRYGIPNWPAAYTPSDNRYDNARKWEAFTSAYRFGGMERFLYDHTNGYVATGNSFGINARLYNPRNKGKDIKEIFADHQPALRTVKTLDRAIATHVSQKDAYFVRLESREAIKADFGLSDSELYSMFDATKRDALIGRTSYQPAFTSISAAVDKNVFGNREFKRYFYIPKGTNIYGTTNDPESEFILGRGLKTQIMKVESGPGGKIILYEMVIGYGKM